MSVRVDSVRAGVTNTYLLRGSGAVLVDPGGARESAAVIRGVRRLLGDRGRIDLVVATHGHFDHAGAAAALSAAFRAPFAVHGGDAAWVRAGAFVWPEALTAWGRLMRGALAPLLARLERFAPTEPDIVIGDEGLDLTPYGVNGRIVATPGHSPGSVTALLPGGEALVGDLAMNGPPMCLRPSFGVFAHDPGQVPESWRRLLDLGARVVYPAHGRPFAATRLRATG